MVSTNIQVCRGLLLRWKMRSFVMNLGPCTSTHSPPEVTHSPPDSYTTIMSLFTIECISIIHCTDDKQLAQSHITLIALLITQSHTLYKPGIFHSDKASMFALATLQSFPCFLVDFLCLIPVRAPGLFSLLCPVWTLFPARLDYCSFSWIISLPSPLDLYADRWPTLLFGLLCVLPLPCLSTVHWPCLFWPCFIIKLRNGSARLTSRQPPLQNTQPHKDPAAFKRTFVRYGHHKNFCLPLNKAHVHWKTMLESF